jgi:hypothetical protein
MFALILSLIMLFSLNSVAHDTVQTRLDKFNENWTNVIAFRGESGKVLIQQHDWIKSCRAVILKPGEKVRVEQYRSSCQDLFDMSRPPIKGKK